MQEIVPGDEALKDKLRAIVRQEFGMAERYPEAFVCVCENEQKFFADLPADLPELGRILIEFITHRQGQGELDTGNPELISDMLCGALCEMALSLVRRRRQDQLPRHIDMVTEKSWSMSCKM